MKSVVHLEEGRTPRRFLGQMHLPAPRPERQASSTRPACQTLPLESESAYNLVSPLDSFPLNGWGRTDIGQVVEPGACSDANLLRGVRVVFRMRQMDGYFLKET